MTPWGCPTCRAMAGFGFPRRALWRHHWLLAVERAVGRLIRIDWTPPLTGAARTLDDALDA